MLGISSCTRYFCVIGVSNCARCFCLLGVSSCTRCLCVLGVSSQESERSCICVLEGKNPIYFGVITIIPFDNL